MKKLIALFVSVFFLFIIFSVEAQTTTAFRKSYNQAMIDLPGNIIEGLTPQTYVLGGTNTNFVPMYGTVSELSDTGLVNWSYRYSDASISFQINDLKKDVANNQYYVCGGSSSSAGVFMTLDAAGNIVLQKKFLIQEADGATFNSVIKTSDGGYVLVGSVTGYDPDGAGPEQKFNSISWTSTYNSSNNTEAINSPLIVKLDQNGNLLWEKVFRYYTNSSKQPSQAIYNDSWFSDVIEVADGYVAVGQYDVDQFRSSTTGSDDDGDQTPLDAMILKTDVNGGITYHKQIDAPSTSASQSNKVLQAVNVTSAGDIIAGGTDDSEELIQKFSGIGGFSNTFSEKYDYGGGFLGANAIDVSEIYEVNGGTDIVTMSMYLEVSIPFPTFYNSIHRVNSTANTTVWTKGYSIGLATILPNGSKTSDGGYICVSTTMQGAGFDYHVIKTDPSGETPLANCQADDLTPSHNNGPTTFTDPYYIAWSNTQLSDAISIIRTSTTLDATPMCTKQVQNCTPPAVASTVTATPSTICQGDSTTITASGTASNVHYDIFTSPTGGTSIGTAPLKVGPNTTTTYYIETVDNSDPTCVSTTRAQVTVTVTPSPTITVDNIQPASCGSSNGGIDISVSGGTSPYTYIWEDASTTQVSTNEDLSGVSQGVYTVTVTDNNSCASDSAITITNSSAPTIDQITLVDESCGLANGSISISASGGTAPLQYSIDNGVSFVSASSFPNLSANTYHIVVEDANGCQVDSIVTLNNTTGPTIDNITLTAPSCGLSDGAISITASGGTAPLQYSIDNGVSFASSGTFSSLPANSYHIVVEGANGCQVDSIVSLSNATGPSIDDVQQTTSSCTVDDGTITVTASGGTPPLSYSLNGGTQQATGSFSDLAPGNYSIEVEDDNGCVTTESVTITTDNPPIASITSSTDVTCSGDSDGTIEVNATGGTPNYTYQWSPSGGTSSIATGLPAGTYSVVVTDNAGCSDTVEATIGSPDAIAITEMTTNALCGAANGSITLTATGGAGGYVYSWSPDVSTTNSATGLNAGEYDVTVTDQNGCSNSISVTVGTENSFGVDAIPDNATIHEGQTVPIYVDIQSGVIVDSIVWTPSTGLSCSDCIDPIASPETTTTYIVTVYDNNGCSSSDTVTIVVEGPCGEIFVPTSFSPNGDGTNDLQCVLGGCIIYIDFSIFDRWGEVVFHTTDQNECWDGIFRGRLVQTGNYVYKLKATLENGEVIEKSGNINVVR